MRVILVATDASPPAPARKDPGAVVVNVKRREIWHGDRVAEFHRAPTQFRAAAAMVVRRGSLLTHLDLIEALYGDDPNGGPLWAPQAVSKWGCHVRRRLRPLGLLQQTIYGHGVRLANMGEPAMICAYPPPSWGCARPTHRSNRRYVRLQGGAQ